MTESENTGTMTERGRSGIKKQLVPMIIRIIIDKMPLSRHLFGIFL